METRTAYLNRYFDPELTPPKTTIKELETAQVERILRSLSVVLYAGGISRRLGADATSEDLALDRKRTRRVGHALKQAASGWTKKMPKLPEGEDLRIEGAQLEWGSWSEVYLVEATRQLTMIVTWSILNEEQRWGRSAVVKLENEINWVTYAMRD